MFPDIDALKIDCIPTALKHSSFPPLEKAGSKIN